MFASSQSLSLEACQLLLQKRGSEWNRASCWEADHVTSCQHCSLCVFKSNSLPC